MYYLVIIPEAVIGAITILILCTLWGGGVLLSQFWPTLLYWAFFILFIPTLGLSLLLYLIGNDDDESKNPPIYRRLLSFCCAYLFPFITMALVERKIINKYIFYKDTEFPFKGTALLILVGVIVVMVLAFMLISKINVFVSLVIWCAIMIASPVIKDNIVEQIAKHEVVTAISFQGKHDKVIYKSTGNYYYNSGMLGDITKDQVEVIDEDGQVKMINRDGIIVYEYISRYDVLMETGADISELLKKE